ncbi:MAG: hypothetical protein ACLVG5_15870 [Clostridium sp.]
MPRRNGGSGSGSMEVAGDGGSGSNGQSFDDFEKWKSAEFDRRVNKAVETAVGKAVRNGTADER